MKSEGDGLQPRDKQLDQPFLRDIYRFSNIQWYLICYGLHRSYFNKDISVLLLEMLLKIVLLQGLAGSSGSH